jgi:hypothetical protein
MKSVLIFLLVALFMLDCSVDNPVGGKADNPLHSSTDEATVVRPRPVAFAITYEETIEVVKPPNPPAGDFTLIIIVRGEGESNRLGHSELYVYEYVDISTSPSNIYKTDEAYITNKNGDKLMGHMTGLGYPKPEGGNTFDGTFYITGGTGEFEGAAGEATFRGETFENPDGPNTGWVRMKGYFIPGMPLI